ncbi:hypothetical protein MMC25_006341 [Agyrium rufum]|nr:hypothetical protein [Agyrium rufum]
MSDTESYEAAISKHSFTAVPRHIPTLLSQIPSSLHSEPLKSIIPLPESSIATAVLEYARTNLPESVLNHSLRVYQYGASISKTFFPSQKLNHETFLFASLLHDIGTTPSNIRGTHLSFEFHGGLIAHALLLSLLPMSEKAQAEAVMEAIIRHQDVDDIGNGEITFLGAVLQLATLYDNAGKNDELVADEARDLVVKEYPRLKWSGCFESVIREECGRKPWAHTTKIGRDNFVALIKGNEKGNAME